MRRKDLGFRQDGTSAGRKGSVSGFGKPLSLRSPGRPGAKHLLVGTEECLVMAVALSPDEGGRQT